MIFYPKIRPLLKSAKGGGAGAGQQMMQGPGGGQQILNVSGFLISPTQMNEMINSSGTILPDEEVELSPYGIFQPGGSLFLGHEVDLEFLLHRPSHFQGRYGFRPCSLE